MKTISDSDFDKVCDRIWQLFCQGQQPGDIIAKMTSKGYDEKWSAKTVGWVIDQMSYNIDMAAGMGSRNR